MVLQSYPKNKTAKSLQSCLTLCDPLVPGILQARTLEWVAISFSSTWKWKVKVKSLSHVWLLVTPWTAAHQAPLSMGFSRQAYWSGVPLPSPTTGLIGLKWFPHLYPLPASSLTHFLPLTCQIQPPGLLGVLWIHQTRSHLPSAPAVSSACNIPLQASGGLTPSPPSRICWEVTFSVRLSLASFCKIWILCPLYLSSLLYFYPEHLYPDHLA